MDNGLVWVDVIRLARILSGICWISESVRGRRVRYAAKLVSRHSQWEAQHPQILGILSEKRHFELWHAFRVKDFLNQASQSRLAPTRTQKRELHPTSRRM